MMNEAQKRARKKYIASHKRFSLNLDKRLYEDIREHAEKKEITVTTYIMGLIRERVKE